MQYPPSLTRIPLKGIVLACAAGSALTFVSLSMSAPANPQKKKPAAARAAKPANSMKGVRTAQLPNSAPPPAPETESVPLQLGVDIAPDPFTPSVRVSVQNRGTQPVTSRIALTNPDNFLGSSRSVQTITIPPKGQSQAKFFLPGAAMAPDSRYAFSAELEANHGKTLAVPTAARPIPPTTRILANRLLSFFRIERAWKTPAMDGSMDGWLNSSMIIVNIPGRPSGGAGWKGRADMTSTVRFLWDQKNLYVMSRRTDDLPKLASSPTDPHGDRVRLALSPTGSHLLDASWVTFDLVPLEEGAVVIRNATPSLKLNPGPVAGAQTSVTEQNGVQVITAAIPWTEIGISKGVKTKRMGLTFRSLDDDGEGIKSWLEWGGGASAPADPTLFSDVSLGD